MALDIKPGQKSIKSKAAVAWAAGEPLKMEEVDVQLPKKGEALFASLLLVFATLMHLRFQAMTQKVSFQQF